MDYSWVKRVVELTDCGDVQKYIETGRWEILSIAPGQDDDHAPLNLFVLGWHGPLDPEFPTHADAASEFPLGR